MSTALIVLENRTLRWSTPGLLNDPFDMQFAFQRQIDRANARALALEKTWRHWYEPLLDRPVNKLGEMIRLARSRGPIPQMTREELERQLGAALDESLDREVQTLERLNEVVRTSFANDKILCLSALPDIILMWSYYAENHAGLVLRFTDQAPESPLIHARAVSYVDEMPSYYSDETLSDLMAGYCGPGAEHLMNQVVWTTSRQWEHEQEWRLYSGRGRTDASHENIPFIAAELDGVIFGARTPADVRARVAALVKRAYPWAELLQAKLAGNQYRLDIENAAI